MTAGSENMDKQEFLNTLRLAMGGILPADQIQETIRYYEDYINTQVRLGKTESQVLQELGDPRLIARSITDVYKAEHGGDGKGQRGGGEAFAANGSAQRGFGREENGWNQAGPSQAGQGMEGGFVPKIFRMPGWLVAVIAFGILFLILALVFSVLAFLAPFILVGLVIAFFIKLFRDWLN